MRARRRVDGAHRRAVAVASREPPAQAREETRLEGEESCEEEVARQEEVVSPQEEVTRVFTHVKLNHPVVMIFSCVGETETPASQARRGPLRGGVAFLFINEFVVRDRLLELADPLGPAGFTQPRLVIFLGTAPRGHGQRAPGLRQKEEAGPQACKVAGQKEDRDETRGPETRGKASGEARG